MELTSDIRAEILSLVAKYGTGKMHMLIIIIIFKNIIVSYFRPGHSEVLGYGYC